MIKRLAYLDGAMIKARLAGGRYGIDERRVIATSAANNQRAGQSEAVWELVSPAHGIVMQILLVQFEKLGL